MSRNAQLQTPRPCFPETTRLRADRSFASANQLRAVLRWSNDDITNGRYRILLYRFLSDYIPAVHSCLWTWVRLAAAPGRYELEEGLSESTRTTARRRLNDLSALAYTGLPGHRVGFSSLFIDLFTSLFRDGRFGGFVVLRSDGAGVDKFLPVDAIDISAEQVDRQGSLYLDHDSGKIDLMRPDFYLLTHNSAATHPLGQSLLQPIPFVAYIEQQLVDDMRRSSHNAGFHKLHIRVTPPERLGGESDTAYTDRINEYFDSTVKMISSCKIEDNPVTWDNIAIEHIGPDKSREVSNSWFMNHRAMIEEVCAGTNLAPFLLGYSYGATTTWAGFKFDVVMRQVRSVQDQAARLLEWLGNIDLALAGLDARCRFVFDNTFAYQAADRLAQQTGGIDNLLKLYQAGLIDESTARERAWNLL
jgi:hypothetical protein